MTDREKLIKILDKANIEHEDYVYTDGTPAIDAKAHGWILCFEFTKEGNLADCISRED